MKPIATNHSKGAAPRAFRAHLGICRLSLIQFAGLLMLSMIFLLAARYLGIPLSPDAAGAYNPLSLLASLLITPPLTIALMSLVNAFLHLRAAWRTFGARDA